MPEKQFHIDPGLSQPIPVKRAANEPNSFISSLHSQAPRGSQHWLQALINGRHHLLDQAIAAQLPGLVDQPIDWLSPLESDDYAEYRDDLFLARLGLSDHAPTLRDFWPARGPRWDGFGHAANGSYILIEAKANIPELITDCRAKSVRSIEQIRIAMARSQQWLRARPRIDWLTGFYQTANRLAHLYFLREIVGVEAYLVFLYFVDDPTHIPTSHAEWRGALAVQKQLLGPNGRPYRDYVVEVFMETREIA